MTLQEDASHEDRSKIVLMNPDKDIKKEISSTARDPMDRIPLEIERSFWKRNFHAALQMIQNLSHDRNRWRCVYNQTLSHIANENDQLQRTLTTTQREKQLLQDSLDTYFKYILWMKRLGFLCVTIAASFILFLCKNRHHGRNAIDPLSYESSTLFPKYPNDSVKSMNIIESEPSNPLSYTVSVSNQSLEGEYTWQNIKDPPINDEVMLQVLDRDIIIFLSQLSTYPLLEDHIPSIFNILQACDSYVVSMASTCLSHRFSDGSVYYGEWNNRGLMNGQGIFHYANNNIYIGEWRDGLITGYGLYYWSANGNVYIGDWMNDQMHGYGIWRDGQDGRYYAGNWLYDKKNGNGQFNWPNGDAYKGVFIDDEMTGKGRYLSHDGILEGFWYEGEFFVSS